MSSYNVYSYTTEDLTVLANQIKDALMDKSGHDDLLDYAVTIGQGSIFNRLSAKILRRVPDKKELNIFITKCIPENTDE